MKEHLRLNLHLQDKVSFLSICNHVLCIKYDIFKQEDVLIVLQSDDPAVQWQLNLYRDVVVKCEEPVNPEHTVSRVQSISAALFHLDLVRKETAGET